MSDLNFLICSVFLCLSFASSSYLNTTFEITAITTHQCSTLLFFKQNLYYFNTSWGCEGENPIMMNWNTNTTNCCYWDGVTCNHSTGDVIGLDLSCGMLQGTLHPNTSLFNLPQLQTLNLASNDFSGSQLPIEIGKLSTTLTHLNLSNCGFSSHVPAEITTLGKLVSLDLSWNDFRLEPRVFIEFLQNCTCLEELLLQSVNISSVLPTHLNISSCPSSSLSSSSYSLKSLNLYRTGLHGKLPHYIFNHQYSLETLDLSWNSFTGQIPWEISFLPKLVSLDLSGNDNLKIKPHIFNTLLQNSTLLRNLWLGGVNIGHHLLLGEIPNSIGHLKFLTYLGLSNCGLTGSIPKSIAKLRNLTYLDLSNNKLNGQIDVLTFQQLTNLTDLFLSHNNFSGYWNLDTLLSSITNLEQLFLSYSGLSITTSNASHYVNPNIYSLQLASCKLNVFPKFLQSMTNLQSLDLSSNQIHGKIPRWAGEIGGSMFNSINLSHNFITELPQFQWYGLQQLYLQSNQIRGPFPPSICNLILLAFLDLSNNTFEGAIPQCFENVISSLIMINLEKNHFKGSIPNVYENCGALEGIILNENQFEGVLPSSLSKCQSLTVIDMGNNNLNGKFPSWLESLPNLQVLVLKSNSFHGHIVPSSTVGFVFPTLQVIDLSHNKFEGQVPRKYFESFNAMKNGTVKRSTTPEYLSVGGLFYSFVVTVKGKDQGFPQLYVYYTIVSLSHNNFAGKIPNIVGNLKSLVVLDLSHNILTGQIPHALGKLSELESLDLSCNQLTGKIPQSLADLTFLGFLNLSQNHLMGRIPIGKQFNTFEENSFEGNPNLCGLPLPKKCNNNPQLEGHGEGDEEEKWFAWKVVMLGYGCGTLFGLAMGYIMLSTGRPMWFNAIVYVVEQMILKRQTKRRYTPTIR